MNDRTSIFEIIDNYLNGNMSEEERLAFEQRIAEDRALAAKVDEVKLTNEAVYYANLTILKENIGKDLQEIKYRPDSGTNWTLLISIAIVTLGLLAGAFLLWEKNNISSIQNTTAAKADPLEEQVNSISDTSNNKTPDEILVDKKRNNIHPKNTGPEKNKTLKTEAITPATDSTKTNQNLSDKGEKDFVPEDEKLTVHADTLPKKSPVSDIADKNISCTKSFNIKTSPSCKERPTGTITIISHGPEELNIEIDNIYKSHSNQIVRDLSSGNHAVKVIYKNECTFTEQVRIEEKWCPVNSSFSFNPDYGERWKIKYEEGDAGKFVIYNSFGKELYESEFGVGNEYWDGTDLNGALVPTGNYLAIINYSDGRSEKIELTIVR